MQVKCEELRSLVAQLSGMMSSMDGDWVRLGAALAAARKSIDISQVEMGERVGISRSAVQNVERGRVQTLTPTIRAFAREVGWTAASIADVLNGGEPTAEKELSAGVPDNVTELPVDRGVEGNRTPGDLPWKVANALAEGPLLDATVISLPAATGDVRMTVVVRGTPDATPEEIRDALETWRRAERRLQHLDEDDDGSGSTANEA